MHRKKNLVDAFHQFISYGHYHILDDDTEGQLKKKPSRVNYPTAKVGGFSRRFGEKKRITKQMKESNNDKKGSN